MIVNYKGLVEKQIGNKTIVFKFTMASITMLNDLQNVNLSEFAQQLKAPKFSTISNFLYAGAEVAYQSEMKNADDKGKRDFVYEDADEWLNTMGITEALEMFLEAFSVPETNDSKN